MEKKLNNLLLISIVCLLAGCTINYNEQGQVKKSEEIPDSVMENFNLVQMKNNSPFTVVKADRTEIYNSKNKTLLYNIEFTEYDSEDQRVITKGNAGLVEYDNETENAQLTKGLNFYSESEEIDITGEEIYWTKETKTIESNMEDSIKVVKEDGSVIEGYGFKADLKNSTFSFKKGVTGKTSD